MVERDRKRLPAFTVDPRVTLILDPDLAHRIGAVVLADYGDDSQALALAHQLQGSRPVSTEPLEPFVIDRRIAVKVEAGLCGRVADILLGSDTPDKQVLAVAHHCRNCAAVVSEDLDDSDVDDGPATPAKALGLKPGNKR